MFTSKPPRINGLLLLTAVVGLVFGSAGPAAANDLTIAKWASQGIGEEWGPSTDELCSNINNVFTGAHFETTYYLITEAGLNYQIQDDNVPVAHYSGSITMNIQHGDMVSAPQGAGPGDCDTYDHLPMTPGPVELTRARVQGSSSGGSVNCDNHPSDLTPGTYKRIESHFRFDFNVSCTIQGNTGYTQTRMVWLNYDVYGTQNTSGYLKGITHSVAISGNGH